MLEDQFYRKYAIFFYYDSSLFLNSVSSLNFFKSESFLLDCKNRFVIRCSNGNDNGNKAKMATGRLSSGRGLICLLFRLSFFSRAQRHYCLDASSK